MNMNGQGQPEGGGEYNMPPHTTFYPPSPGRAPNDEYQHHDRIVTGQMHRENEQQRGYDGYAQADPSAPAPGYQSEVMGAGGQQYSSNQAEYNSNGSTAPTQQQDSTEYNNNTDTTIVNGKSTTAVHGGIGNGNGNASKHSHTHRNKHHSTMQETEEELTEDELIEYENGLLTWEKAKNWRFWFRKEWIWWYIIFIVLVVLVALMAFFHHSIIDWLSPFVQKLRTIKAGFCIPVAILFVLSFPPLFGNEIVIVLVGLVWGLGKGFAIVVVGVCLGEISVFLMFRYLCHARAERMTRKSLNYACLSEAIREGGFIMAFVVRLSVIPTHYTTAVFAVCGLKFWQYLIALFGGLPKQLISVYVGVVLGQTNASTNSHVISDCVFAACAIITLGALWFIYKRMIRVRKRVLIGMRDDLKRHNVQVVDLPQEIDGGGEEGGGRTRKVMATKGNEWDRLKSIDSPRQQAHS